MLKNIPDTSIRNDLEYKMCHENYVFRRIIAKKLIEECNLNSGEIFIVPRSNKFYSLNPEKANFRVHVDNNDKDLRELLPQKDFKEMYSKVNFYVFTVKEKFDIVRDKFIEITQKPLSEKMKKE